MKKVRFKTIDKRTISKEMDIIECHSPRPYIVQQEGPVATDSNVDLYARILQMKSDPFEMYESSNSSPYMLTNKTDLGSLRDTERRFMPSSDLELSMLDATSQEPRKQPFSIAHTTLDKQVANTNQSNSVQQTRIERGSVLSPIENTNRNCPSNVLTNDNSFFIRRENVQMMQLQNTNILEKQFSKFTIGKENNPIAKKAEFIRMGIPNQYNNNVEHNIYCSQQVCSLNTPNSDKNVCNWHHCQSKCTGNTIQNKNFLRNNPKAHFSPNRKNILDECHCAMNHCTRYVQEPHVVDPSHINKQNCQKDCMHNYVPQNAIDKKTWVIQKYEQAKKSDCTEIEKPSIAAKEKREPTVADLFKIIKLQNEQLQLLQQKVDKFVSCNNSSAANDPPPALPSENFVTEHVSLETIENNHHKISIGVMTSFEMVRTSTVINKEVIKQNINQNAQVQCNKSQISIQEVTVRQPVNQNFLDGISPVARNPGSIDESNDSERPQVKVFLKNQMPHEPQNVAEEKALNELSLYNVQVDNSTTPMISPEQTMYLDVRDYSDSDTGSDNQSNVGWTYYNKVMTHVNGMLQDSDMPSSASALYRNTRQQCVQMQIDKTNISVTKRKAKTLGLLSHEETIKHVKLCVSLAFLPKEDIEDGWLILMEDRVKFGDDPLGLQQPHLQPASTDTSLKMNLLAAKYLKQPPQKQITPRNVPVTSDEMSYATRNYMEKHQLLYGLQQPIAAKTPIPQVLPQAASRSPTLEMPRFLDITALKQQPKLL